MKDSAYLAHISSSGSSQLLLDHLEGTARLAKDFALPFGGEEQAELAGLSHDIGKYSKAFQDRLHGNPMRGSCSSHLPLLQWRDIMAVFPMAEAEWIHLIKTPCMADSKSKETGC